MELSHSNSRGFSILEYFKFKIILVLPKFGILCRKLGKRWASFLFPNVMETDDGSDMSGVGRRGGAHEQVYLEV